MLCKLETIGIMGELHKLLQSFLSNRFQRVVLNGQSSTWSPILAGVPQGLILGSLLFLVYIIDLSKDLEFVAKLFADDTSLFSAVQHFFLSVEIMNNDFIKISWEMSFSPDPTKQAQEVIFLRK